MNHGGQRQVALAEAIAVWAHANQTDKNGYDYIDHPRAVFYRIFADDVEDYDGQIVAWLHDVLEDTDVDADDLVTFFPMYIIEALIAISRHYHEKGDAYYYAVKANPIALRVKLQDIAHNTSPRRLSKLPADVQARLKKKYAHALEVLNG